MKHAQKGRLRAAKNVRRLDRARSERRRRARASAKPGAPFYANAGR